VKRSYFLLLGASIISNVGDWMFKIAMPLLVYRITSSASSMALTYGLTYLPYLLFLPYGGILADRFNRRRLLVGGDVISALLMGLLALYVWYGQPSMRLIYVAVFILAGVVPFYHPAFQSMIPEVVSRKDLPRANSWLHSSENLVALIGPALAGLFIARYGIRFVLFLDAGSFLLSALLISHIHLNGHTSSIDMQKNKTPWFHDLRDGFSFVWKQPVIRSGALLFMGTNFATTLVQSNYIFFLSKQVKLNNVELGLALAIPGLGAIAGAYIAPKVMRWVRPGDLILGCTMLAGLLTLPMLWARNMISASLPWAAVTAFGTINMVTWFTMRQDESIVPKVMLGRVIAISRLMAYLMIPLSAVLGGAILNWTHNLTPLIIIAALLRLVVGCIGFKTPLHSSPNIRDVPLEQQERVRV
jgi:MFS family permease